jgi:hypothetical protein
MEDTRRHEHHWSSPDYDAPPECACCGAELEPNSGALCPECEDI